MPENTVALTARYLAAAGGARRSATSSCVERFAPAAGNEVRHGLQLFVLGLVDLDAEPSAVAQVDMAFPSARIGEHRADGPTPTTGICMLRRYDELVGPNGVCTTLDGAHFVVSHVHREHAALTLIDCQTHDVAFDPAAPNTMISGSHLFAFQLRAE